MPLGPGWRAGVGGGRVAAGWGLARLSAVGGLFFLQHQPGVQACCLYWGSGRVGVCVNLLGAAHCWGHWCGGIHVRRRVPNANPDLKAINWRAGVAAMVLVYSAAACFERCWTRNMAHRPFSLDRFLTQCMALACCRLHSAVLSPNGFVAQQLL